MKYYIQVICCMTKLQESTIHTILYHAAVHDTTYYFKWYLHVGI